MYVSSYHIISYHSPCTAEPSLKLGTDKPKLKVEMQSVSDDDVQKRLLEKPRFCIRPYRAEYCRCCCYFWFLFNRPKNLDQELIPCRYSSCCCCC